MFTSKGANKQITEPNW